MLNPRSSLIYKKSYCSEKKKGSTLFIFSTSKPQPHNTPPSPEGKSGVPQQQPKKPTTAITPTAGRSPRLPSSHHLAPPVSPAAPQQQHPQQLCVFGSKLVLQPIRAISRTPSSNTSRSATIHSALTFSSYTGSTGPVQQRHHRHRCLFLAPSAPSRIMKPRFVHHRRQQRQQTTGGREDRNRGSQKK